MLQAMDGYSHTTTASNDGATTVASSAFADPHQASSTRAFFASTASTSSNTSSSSINTAAVDSHARVNTNNASYVPTQQQQQQQQQQHYHYTRSAYQQQHPLRQPRRSFPDSSSHTSAYLDLATDTDSHPFFHQLTPTATAYSSYHAEAASSGQSRGEFDDENFQRFVADLVDDSDYPNTPKQLSHPSSATSNGQPSTEPHSPRKDTGWASHVDALAPTPFVTSSHSVWAPGSTNDTPLTASQANDPARMAFEGHPLPKDDIASQLNQLTLDPLPKLEFGIGRPQTSAPLSHDGIATLDRAQHSRTADIALLDSYQRERAVHAPHQQQQQQQQPPQLHRRLSPHEHYRLKQQQRQQQHKQQQQLQQLQEQRATSTYYTYNQQGQVNATNNANANANAGLPPLRRTRSAGMDVPPPTSPHRATSLAGLHGISPSLNDLSPHALSGGYSALSSARDTAVPSTGTTPPGTDDHRLAVLEHLLQPNVAIELGVAMDADGFFRVSDVAAASKQWKDVDVATLALKSRCIQLDTTMSRIRLNVRDHHNQHQQQQQAVSPVVDHRSPSRPATAPHDAHMNARAHLRSTHEPAFHAPQQQQQQQQQQQHQVNVAPADMTVPSGQMAYAYTMPAQPVHAHAHAHAHAQVPASTAQFTTINGVPQQFVPFNPNVINVIHSQASHQPQLSALQAIPQQQHQPSQLQQQQQQQQAVQVQVPMQTAPVMSRHFSHQRLDTMAGQRAIPPMNKRHSMPAGGYMPQAYGAMGTAGHALVEEDERALQDAGCLQASMAGRRSFQAHGPASHQHAGGNGGSMQGRPQHRRKGKKWSELIEEQNVPESEHDLWYFMKLIRLHKYTPKFYGMTLDQVKALTDEDLTNMGMTKGAQGKLRLELSLLPPDAKTFPRRLRRDRYEKLNKQKAEASAAAGNDGTDDTNTPSSSSSS
ncbi:hypothetical protein PTSG_09032 [Salpingoeca rosetta]|uniref:SAM domain-containing protein n=1 Tax=Salpingoeca rosetta (strain ATCC 50818 / BSB-021) TaxID=946362 RepID=F2UM06_SALR5|nr:uncharacterized protein PTSG_09032 [Salpingoeca rosetta]EGD78155.1 hypothetical protein PTSG_09032 [Salpingoeca rosetta]|eukprot:XP_004989831.1 hypothetical protein PTSG_09032 [Salpingoeca rosetta]